MHFGEQLRGLREAHHLSQAELAKEIGLSQTYISALEDRDTVPRIKTLETLANYFGIQVSEFLPKPVDERLIKLKSENIRLKATIRAIRKLLNQLDID